MIVLDASVAAKWIIAEKDHERAKAVRDVRRDVIAPQRIVAELVNAVRRRERAGELSPEQVDAGLERALALIDAFIDDTTLWTEALAFCRRFDHSVYDCFFLACTALGGVLVTADDTLARKIADVRLRARILTLQQFTPELLDAACALAAVEPIVDGLLEPVATSYADEVDRRMVEPARAIARGGTRALQTLSKRDLEGLRVIHEWFMAQADARRQFGAKRFLDEFAKLTESQRADLVAIYVFGADHAAVSEWAAAKDVGRDIAERLNSDSTGSVWLTTFLLRWRETVHGASMIRDAISTRPHSS